MAFWNRRSKQPVEARSSIEDPKVAISNARIIEFFGFGADTAAGIHVDNDAALSVPAIWAAVNFLSGTMAGLPLHVYRRGEDGAELVTDEWANVLQKSVSDEMSSFAWRKYTYERVFTGGRGYTLIERNGPILRGLVPLIPKHVTPEFRNGRRVYRYKPNNTETVYQARDIIDIPFMLKEDQLAHYGPIQQNRDTVALGIAATNYGSRFFQNGGVPPFVVTGGFQTGAALDRASKDLEEAVKRATRERRQALTLPSGHEIKGIGSDPEKAQLVELKKFLIEEYARIYSLPPVFLQDLSRATFSNTEQQDLHLVKHTIRRWVEQFEQEVNLKLFRGEPDYFAKLELDGLLRGDFKTRMEGYALGIQNSITTPNEARKLENRPAKAGGDDLMIQGATVPLGRQPMQGDSNDV